MAGILKGYQLFGKRLFHDNVCVGFINLGNFPAQILKSGRPTGFVLGTNSQILTSGLQPTGFFIGPGGIVYGPGNKMPWE